MQMQQSELSNKHIVANLKKKKIISTSHTPYLKYSFPQVAESFGVIKLVKENKCQKTINKILAGVLSN